MYSITDRASLAGASSILGGVTAEEEQGGNQVLLLGNKRDLDHLREVSSSTTHTIVSVIVSVIVSRFGVISK